MIDNAAGRSHDWRYTELGVLRIAAAYYRDARLCGQLAKARQFAEGRYLPYARLTHSGGC